MIKHLKRFAAVMLATSLVVSVCHADIGKTANAVTVTKSANLMTASANEDDGADGLTEITQCRAKSVDGKIEVRVWKNKEGAYFYSAYRNGHVTLKCSPLGMVTTKENLSTGLELDETSVELKKGKEEYDWYQGSKKHVNKEYQEMSFVTKKNNAKMQVIFRIFEDGIGFRYVVDADTTKTDEVTEITSEESSFEFPMDGRVWNADWYSATYEPGSYSTKTMNSVKSAESDVPPAILSEVPNGNGSCYMLLSEANVYNEKEPYCASIFHTSKNSAAYKVKFGTYLVQENDPAYVGKTFEAKHEQIKSVKMTNEFHTPWRVCVMTDNLNDLTNSSLISDLNPAAEGDFSWVEPGTASWSWWSTGDPIEYESLYDYIDYAKETGQKYCLVDFGWENWKDSSGKLDYEEKLKKLCAYANERNVGILVWYGVKKRDNAHRVDLDNPEIIEKEFAWCESLGIKGVKVDYLESDSQWAMKDMYNIASIAAKHKLVLNYHGCTDPNGENRTFPNILSSEAVQGSEYFKWGSGSPVETLLTLPYTRNVIGSMEFTPVGMSVKNCKATNAFMLGMTVVYESAMQTLAHSCHVYPGYGGLSFLTDIPASWDESVLLAGSEPRKAAIRARKSGDRWYLGAMTAAENNYEADLSFLDPDTKYYAYVYTDNADNSNIQMEKKEVTSKDKLTLAMKKNGGAAVIFSKKDDLRLTSYDNYNYFEAENANLGETNKKPKNALYVSNKAYIEKIRGANNRVKFEKIEAPEAGMYDLKLYVVSATKKKLSVRVNHYESVEVSDLVGINGNNTAVGCKSTKVYLDKGMNTLYIYNASTTGPGLDRIAISKNKVEDGTAPKTATDYPELYLDYPVATPTPVPTATAAPTQTPVPSVSPVVTQTPAPTTFAANNNTNVNVLNSLKVKKTVKAAKVKGLKAKSKKKKQVLVTFAKAKNAEGYQVSYSLNKKFKKAKTISTKKTSVTIKKLKSKKKYYVRVRAYCINNKAKSYSAWTKSKAVKVK